MHDSTHHVRPARSVEVSRRPRRGRRLSLGVAGGLVAAVLVALAVGAEAPGQVAPGPGAPGFEGPTPTAPARAEPDPPSRPRRLSLRPAAPRHLGGGAASYYSDALDGRLTASGEPYRSDRLTAAHRTLPFGVRVRVTNLANGRSAVVRVNDRGPFAGRRVIDVSRAAAKRLGMIDAGHARVRLEILE